MKLTNAEEQIMKYLWKLGKGYMKNILDEFPEPKPATTTVATLLKRMTEKGFVGYKQRGSNREYFPLVRKSDYSARHLELMIKDFFNDSAAQFASFFTNETRLSRSELEEIKRLVEEKLKDKNN